MLPENQNWMMLVSFIVGTIASYVSFQFVSSLFRTSAQAYLKTLYVYSIFMGMGLLAIHAMNMHSFGYLYTIQDDTYINLVLSFGFAVIIGLTVLDISHRKSLPVKSLIIGGLQSGISNFGIFYFYAKATIASPYQISVLPAVLAVTLSMLVGMLSIVTYYWLKRYDGRQPNQVKVFFAFLISIGLYATHTAFVGALSIADNANHMLNSNTVTLLGALVLTFIFLTAFIIIIFYDRVDYDSVQSINFKNSEVTGDFNESFDPLTKLPNRNALNQHLSIAASRCDRTGESMALAYIDLDHFKPVNDNFGHHIGDLLLIEVAERFNSAIRNCDYIARNGGDEFVAILGEINAHESIVAVVQRVVDTVKEPFYIENHVIEISCSVGVAIYPGDGNLEKLKINADAAMYKAKETGRNQYRFYDAEIEQASDEMQQTRRELLEAIEHDQFTLYFQPKVLSKTYAPIGAETLLRWNHPTKGLLTPIHFIEAAERFGFIEKINYWVLVQACKTISRAHREGVMLHLSLNLSRQQFRNIKLVDQIKAVMDKYNVPPQCLIFEISETHAIHNQNQFKKLLSKFKSAKLKVSIDDFGLHPFSLTYLQNLEVSEIKLDKSFTAGVAGYSSALAIIDAVVKLAHALNLSVVAEGIETEEQRDALQTTGCDQMQGYYFSRPIPEQALFSWFLDSHHRFQHSGTFAVDAYKKPETPKKQA
ncbi:MAG: EAL domain-containing protein [Methylophilus sp.]|nr:EAL domain-containing protein [Methylophilus sp.]